MKLPKARGDGKELEWGTCDQAHPFWAIKRKETAEDKDNLVSAIHEMVFVCTCDWAGNYAVKLVDDHTPTRAARFTVRMPVITNANDLTADTELILRCHVQRKEVRKTKQTSWVEEVAAAEKKRRLLEKGT